MIERLKGTKPDALSRALGDGRFETNHVIPELVRELYPKQKGHTVTVSRFYLLRQPKAMVDFEQPPQFGKMHCEAKRRWCHAHRIADLPVFLRERLTPEQFQARVEDETKAMELGIHDAVVHERAAAVEDDASIQRFIEEEVRARLKAEERERCVRYTGFARTYRVKALCAAVAEELKRKAHDGQLGYELRSRELAVAAG